VYKHNGVNKLPKVTVQRCLDGSWALDLLITCLMLHCLHHCATCCTVLQQFF